MGQVAFLFAGQGAQYTGMGKSICEASPAAKEVFELADFLRPGTMEQCFQGTKEALSTTENTQPCLFTVDYACAAALKETGVEAHMTLGFSLGEVAAACFSGMLSFQSAFLLVCERARLMQGCATKYPGAMAAVLKLTAEQVEKLTKGFSRIYPVNYNCPGQTVVSGLEEEMPAFEQAVKLQGGRFMRLPVSGSFHSPFMEEAAIGLLGYMEGLEFHKPQIPLYANATGELYGVNPAKSLAEQIKSPVLFQKCVERMKEDGCTACIEVGAGSTLSGFVKKIGGVEHIFHVEDAESLHATVNACKEAGLC